MEQTNDELQAKCIDMANWLDARPNKATLPRDSEELLCYILTKASMMNPALMLAQVEVKSATIASFWVGYRKGLEDANVERLLRDDGTGD